MKESVVRLQDEIVNASEYTEELVRGFQSAYQAAIHDPYVEELLAGFFEEKSRVILRHTQQYAMYQSVSLHPDYMGSREQRKELLSVIHKEKESQLEKEIHDYEISSLLDMDIPYFEIDGHSCGLYDGNGKCYANYLPCSPYEAWRMHFDQMDTKDMNRQSDLIRLSMAMLGSNRSKERYAAVFKQPALPIKARLEEQIHKIVSWICDSAVIAGQDVNWIGLQFWDKQRWGLVPSGMFSGFLANIRNRGCFMSIRMIELGKAIKKLYKGPKPEEEQKYSIEQFTYGSYIKAWQMMREKRNELLFCVMQMKEHNSDGGEFFYDIPQYLAKVCDLLRRLLGRIALIDCKNITVTILYQIPEQNVQWKCIDATGEWENSDVSEFIDRQDSHFFKLMKGDILSFCIENPREGEQGELFGTRIDFESLEEKFVNGILLISTRGQTFRDVNQYCETEGKSFETVLVYSVLPYFAEMIEAEFGTMYLWEQLKKQ